MPSSSRSKSSSRRQRHVPLAEDLVATGPLRTKSKKRKARPDHEDDTENNYIDSRSSRKILKIGQDLQDEEQAEQRAGVPNPAFAFESRLGGGSESESEEELDRRRYDDDDGNWGSDEEQVAEEAEMDPKDIDLFNKFNPIGNQSSILQSTANKENESGESTNLADLILEKIAAHEAGQEPQPAILGGGPPEDAIELPPKVVEVYTKYSLPSPLSFFSYQETRIDLAHRIGLLLSRYKSGKLPKPFKILPTLPSWPILLSLTHPETWTPNACYEATRIFVSSKPATVQEFLNTVILDRVRSDIHETKKLNVHLYNSLKKSLYKPAAFFKGFLFPLVGSGTCTLREAHIISSVLVRVSVPVLHSAAALLRLTEIAAEQTSATSTESAGATNIFIRVLLEKKYALPYKVIDGLVFHFLRYRVVRISNGEGIGQVCWFLIS